MEQKEGSENKADEKQNPENKDAKDDVEMKKFDGDFSVASAWIGSWSEYSKVNGVRLS